MANAVIENTTKRVIVLKALGMPTLRLFPGHNYVEEEGLGKYFKTKAAKARQNIDLEMIDRVLTEEEKLAAEESKKKNEKLNKAQRVIKQQDETLAQNDQTINDQAKEIAKLQRTIARLEKKMEAIDEITEDGKKKGK